VRSECAPTITIVIAAATNEWPTQRHSTRPSAENDAMICGVQKLML
jgi:hypothetical protein